MAKKKARTEFGRELAKLRIDFNETGQDMADKLGMSNSNLHSIEMGATSAGFDLIEKIKALYGKDLEDAFVKGGGLARLEIDTATLPDDVRDVAIAVWKVSQGLLKPKDFWAVFDDFGVPGVIATPGPIVTANPGSDAHAITASKPAPAAPATGWQPPPLPDDVGFLSEEDLAGLDDL